MTSPSIIQDMLHEAAATPSLVQARAQALVAQWQSPPMDATEWAELMLQSERVAKIHCAGQQNNASLMHTLDAVSKQWSDTPRLPVAPGMESNVANRMVQEIGPLDTTNPTFKKILIKTAFEGRKLTETTVQQLLDIDQPFDLMIEDEAFDTALINALTSENIDTLAAFTASRYRAPVSHAISFRSVSDPAIVASRESAKFARYDDAATRDYRDRAKNDELRWILTYVPTPDEAKADGFTYPDYLNFYFEACDQPWPQIKQSQQKLKAAFDQGRELHITNNDGTDIRMSLEGHTFANSVIARNLPGSEIFSGPVKDSVDGTLVAKGNFAIDVDGKVKTMKDITLHFSKGRIIDGHAAEGNDALQEILALEDGLDPSDPRFEGSRHIGEIGIGTNPYIRQHLVNGLLVEKISGSFHLALGGAYGNAYLGEPTLMDNGNRSRIHWDLTTMLRGKDGRMELDGHLLQQDGTWVPCPALGIAQTDVAVLNDGWAALPDKDRPLHWRQKLRETSLQK